MCRSRRPSPTRDERSVPVEKSPELRLVRNVREALATPIRSNLTLAAPTTAQPKVAAAAAPQPQIDVPPVISAIGTAIFNLISFGEGRDRGTSQGPAGQRRQGRAVDPGPGRRPRRARGLVLPGVQRRPRERDAAGADHLSAARLPRQGRLLRLHRVLPGQVDEQRRRRPHDYVEHLRHRRHVAGRRPDAPRRRRSVQRFQPRPARQRTGRRVRAGPTTRAGRPRRAFARRRAGDRHRALHDGRTGDERASSPVW